jgi:hypothetical protein
MTVDTFGGSPIEARKTVEIMSHRAPLCYNPNNEGDTMFAWSPAVTQINTCDPI